MAYENITYEFLLNRMLSRISDTYDKREGSFLFSSNAPSAAELQELYIQLDNILNETFVDTCTREPLLKRMSERGLYPDPATKAILKCVITPSTVLDSDVIGARFNIDNLNYTVINFTDPVTRDSFPSGTFKIECETAGEAGNYPIGTLTVINNEIPNMTSAEIPSNAILIRGDDEESTESCRQKYFDSLNTIPFGGNVADYKNKIKDATAMGVSVGAVKVFPNTNSSGESGHGGYVRILILDSNLDVASSTLIDTIQEQIDPTQDGNGIGIAPIGHIVYIDTTENEGVSVKITGTLTDGITWNDIKSDVEAKITEYFGEVKEDWEADTTGILYVNAQELHGYIQQVTGFVSFTVQVKITGGEYSLQTISISNNKVPNLAEATFVEV